MMEIYLGLGSNLGDREAHLVMAKDLLMKHDVLVLGQSSVLETAPLGGLDQPLYLNQVIEVRTELSPEELLRACKQVEREMGREVELPPTGGVGNVSFGAPKKASGPRWASRVIDIDILLYGEEVVQLPHLQIPHYGIRERDFVMAGLLELSPELVHPVSGEKLNESPEPDCSE